jgi:hypothetical protein
MNSSRDYEELFEEKAHLFAELLKGGPERGPKKEESLMTRYFTNAIIALLAGFVVVATQVFATPTVAWLAFGIAVVSLVISALLNSTVTGASYSAFWTALWPRSPLY